jgi:hypothetical protein
MRSVKATVVDPGRFTNQAYQILHLAFVVLPIIAGLDKFANLLTQWDRYLAPQATRILGEGTRPFMQAVGIVEIAAGLIVAIKPRIGAYIVTAWLWLIVINLALHGGFWDIAARDLFLSLGSLALARLAVVYDPVGTRVPTTVERPTSQPHV